PDPAPPGPAGLRARPARPAPAAPAARGTVRGGRAVDPTALRLSAGVPRRADRGDGARAEDRQVPGHAAAALLGPAPALDAPRPGQRLSGGAPGEAAGAQPPAPPPPPRRS